MTEPTNHDLIQDGRLDALDDLVHPYHVEYDGPEYSFPIVGQGVSAEQYRQTNLGTGNGILHRFPETYYLDTHATAAETNQRNSLILKVTRHNEPGAVAEAIINGYFHRMTEDIEIPMPPVISPTDVYVALTYDPREEESETGPISVQTHNGSLPTTHGREHIIIAKPEMRPNQLLSSTPMNRQRQYSSPVVYVPNHTTVPRSEDFLYGTTLIMGVNGRGRILHNWSGQEGWNDLLVGEWRNMTGNNSWTTSSAKARHRLGGVDVMGRFNAGGAGSVSVSLTDLPEGMALATTFRTVVWTTDGPTNIEVRSEGPGRGVYLHNVTKRPSWVDLNIFIPDAFLRTP